ncbi:hypothetical protein [Pengzhenrongella frigida]|uniref:Uncharacterized protein n=1 Tax=Pengzhenrongella frigida TaxID=1259133 RepID=A0A4V1ZHH0_9MICO|nr:hypothetical protein [Cellulomonas sp. HLT2-17]RYV52014.1 hypothetical protein EUA98_05445 [Cellulomonas sp. HLT2-17]
MSTLPGHDAWRDAGLSEVDPAGIIEIEPEPDSDLDGGQVDEEYEPGEPRPDLRGEADAADVTEQSAELPPDDREEYP